MYSLYDAAWYTGIPYTLHDFAQQVHRHQRAVFCQLPTQGSSTAHMYLNYSSMILLSDQTSRQKKQYRCSIFSASAACFSAAVRSRRMLSSSSWASCSFSFSSAACLACISTSPLCRRCSCSLIHSSCGPAPVSYCLCEPRASTGLTTVCTRAQ